MGDKDTWQGHIPPSEKASRAWTMLWWAWALVAATTALGTEAAPSIPRNAVLQESRPAGGGDTAGLLLTWDRIANWDGRPGLNLARPVSWSHS